MEAACSQIDKHTYICICPHDYSQPNEELKCLNRPTGIYFYSKGNTVPN